ncbi:MAG TPA: zinc ribbon domain-containing protein [Verrucomicrobiae bacterium]|jgi:hypothetical protein|nr:zinc ribbon domain-containing protein [Verrucomicrobiae bacterium]
MSDVVQETQQEFWQPPSPKAAGEVVLQTIPTMAEACPRCGSEFLLGSRFCHSCGHSRPEALSPATRNDAAELANGWQRVVARIQMFFADVVSGKAWRAVDFPSWLEYLHFHNIQRWVGLSTASLIAFVIGLGCVAGALCMGLITAKTLVDWQAVQIYRVEWLLGATAAFVAGILLKRSGKRNSE